MSIGQQIINIGKKYFTTAPVIFSLIGLFHIFFFFYVSSIWIDSNIAMIYWLRPVVFAAYTIFWIGACFLRRKWATAYLILTMLTVTLHFFGPSNINNLDGQGFVNDIYNQFVLLRRAVGDILLIPLPTNILFCFIILLYYRRMQPQRYKTNKPSNEEVKVTERGAN